MKLFIMDAFTNKLFGGNPAGVVVLNDGESFPEDETMRLVAAELRYSETAFVKPLGNGLFQTRYFTPEAEVELCGHATIATFTALKVCGLAADGSCRNRTLAGELAINISADGILMEMAVPKAIDTITEPEKLAELYEVMGLQYNASHGRALCNDKETNLLPEMISTGLPDIMMPVADEAALAQIAPDFPALAALSNRYGVVGVHAFTVNTADGQVRCRNFGPAVGIDEEAATGTANGALTYYLYKNGLLGPGAKTTFIQGEAMGRPSQIKSLLAEKDNGVTVSVGGCAVMLASGELLL